MMALKAKAYLWAIDPSSRIDGQAKRQSSEEANAYSHQLVAQQNLFQVLFFQPVVLRNEVHVVGQIRSVRPLGLHVAFNGFFLSFGVKGDRKFEQPTGYFGFGQISD